jgi:hypothetical protein
MAHIGYAVMTEQTGPRDLVAVARARTVPLGSRRPARVGGDQQLPFIAWAGKTPLPALREL